MTFRFPTLEEIDARVAGLHASPWTVYVATTGAAGGLREDLWRSPDASKTILSMPFLYDQGELRDFIRHAPEQYCSGETALRMAAAAYAKGRQRVVESDKPHRPVLGIGMTATVNPGNRLKKGDHHVHIAAKTDDAIWEYSEIFEKGRWTREQEGRLCDLRTLDAILYLTTNRYLLEPDPRPLTEANLLALQLRDQRLEDGCGFWVDDSRLKIEDLDPAKHLIYPGSYNPLHHGHEQVAEMAELVTGKKVVFQLTGIHPKKGPVPDDVLAKRMHQFLYRWPSLVLEKDALYVDKARRLPGFGFIIGADAVLDMLNPVFYEQGIWSLDKALEEFDRMGTRFHVFGRVCKLPAGGGVYMTIEDILRIHPEIEAFRHLFGAVQGRWDVSSTDLRGGK